MQVRPAFYISPQKSPRLTCLASYCMQVTWHIRHSALLPSAADKSNTDSKVAAVRDEFAAAGLSAQAIDNVLSRYPPFRSWGANGKVRTAIQQWTQELGPTELCRRLQKYPKMLCSQLSEASAVVSWLKSMGTNPDRVLRQAPPVIYRELSAVQSSLSGVQNAAQYTDAQMSRFLHRHVFALTFDTERNLLLLNTIATLLGVPVSSPKLRKTLLVCDKWLFNKSASTFQQRIQSLCSMVGQEQGIVEQAIKSKVYHLSEQKTQARLFGIQRLLGWDNAEVKHQARNVVRLLQYCPEKIAKSIRSSQEHGFALNQVKFICSSTPTLLVLNLASSVQSEKTAFLTHMLGLTMEQLASRPIFLLLSLDNRVGPRLSFLFQHCFITSHHDINSSGHIPQVQALTDAGFHKRYSKSPKGQPIAYDEAYRKHWREHQSFLRQDMKFSMKTIAAHEDLLRISLPRTLAPRWQTLRQNIAKQADFDIEEHLQAMATLADEVFAQKCGSA